MSPSKPTAPSEPPGAKKYEVGSDDDPLFSKLKTDIERAKYFQSLGFRGQADDYAKKAFNEQYKKKNYTEALRIAREIL